MESRQTSKGRFREFYQCDVDYIGTNSKLCEAEIIDLVYTLFDKLKITDIDFKLNNRKILQGIAETLNFPERFNEICIMIDKIDKIGFDKFEKELNDKKFELSSIKKLIEILKFKGSNTEKINFIEDIIKNSNTGIEGIKEIREINELNENYILDFSLARGLSYYTSSIFEVKSNKESIGSLCGGGRYENLTEKFGVKNMPGIGISFGMERIFELLDGNDNIQNVINDNKVLLSYLDVKFIPKCLEIANQLRVNNISVDLVTDNFKLKKQLKYANKNNIPYVLIVGEDEINTNCFTLKNMKNGEQEKNLLMISFLR